MTPKTGALTVTDPCTLQLGCVAVIIGAAGEADAAFIITVFDAPEVPHALVAVTVYVPGTTFIKMPDVLFAILVPPLIRLYVTPAIGELTVTEPCTLQLGCVAIIIDAAGEAGAAFIVTVFDAADVPHAFVAVTV